MSYKSDSGKRLNVVWGIGARHALYRQDGKWFHKLVQFPGALCDPNGYVLFKTEEQFLSCPYLEINNCVHVKGNGTISGMPGYVKMVD